MRLIMVAILVLVLSLGATSFYYRHKTDQLLRIALETIPNRPKEAFDRFMPVLNYSDTLTFGAAQRACETFRIALINSTVDALQTDPVTRKTYFDAAEAMNTLTTLERSSDGDYSAEKIRLLQAVKDSSTRVLSGGTLSAWDAMKSFFDDMRVIEGNKTSTMEPFLDWLASLQEIPRAPLAVRDAINEASEDFRRGLNSLGLTPTSAEGELLDPVPLDLPPERLMQAELSFQNALRAIDVLQTEIDEQRRSTTLEILIGKLNYNIGVLRLSHRLEGSAALRRMGSEYIVQSGIDTDARVFPSNEALYDKFMENAVNFYLARAFDTFANMGESVDLSLIAGLATLCQYHAAWALMADSQAVDPAWVLERDWFEAAQAGPAGKNILEALKAPSRALLIVQVP